MSYYQSDSSNCAPSQISQPLAQALVTRPSRYLFWLLLLFVAASFSLIQAQWLTIQRPSTIWAWSPPVGGSELARDFGPSASFDEFRIVTAADRPIPDAAPSVHVDEAPSALGNDGASITDTTGPIMYTVEKQDNLTAIAQHFGVDISALIYVNGLRDPNRVLVGETLMIPRAAQPPSASSSASSSLFLWPVEGVISQHFSRLHQGIDIAQAQGATIQAIGKGRVVHAEKLETDYGWFLVIDHGNGFQSLYAHLSAFFVYAGQWVEAGQAIGRVGSTGKSTGPHLHFEVRLDGYRINPLDQLP